MLAASIKVFLRTDFTKKDGTHPIYLRIIIRRKKRDFSLGLSSSKKNWDPHSLRIRKSGIVYDNFNIILSDKVSNAYAIVRDFTIKQKQLTFEEFERLFRGNNKNNQCFFSFVESELQNLKSKFTEGTIHIYNTQISKLKKFRPVLTFDDIDVRFLKDYETYMYSVLGNNDNTISKTFSWLRSVMNKAITSGITENYPFKDYHLKRIEGNRDFLTIPELEKLVFFYKTQELDKHTHEILRYFLFSCFTGLRYTDVEALRFQNISDGIIHLTMIKTKEVVRIPLIEQAKSLIGEGFPEQKVFKVLTNHATNKKLKILLKMAGINKDLSFHCGRHSFATIGISLGMPIEVISKLLGHKEIRTTQIYARVEDSVKVREMGKWTKLG
jgi:integrase/recombinase XerC